MIYLADKILKMKTLPSIKGQSVTPSQMKKILAEFLVRCEAYHSAVQMVFTDELFNLFGDYN